MHGHIPMQMGEWYCGHLNAFSSWGCLAHHVYAYMLRYISVSNPCACRRMTEIALWGIGDIHLASLLTKSKKKQLLQSLKIVFFTSIALQLLNIYSDYY